MEIIYVDSLFLFDLLTDYLLCLLTARFCALTMKRKRYLLAAMLGGAYSVAVFLPGCEWLGLMPCRIAAAGIMGIVAFGGEEKLLRCILSYIVLSAACGGMMYALGLDRGNVELWKLTGLFLLCYGFLSLLSVARSRLSGLSFTEGEVEFCGNVYPFRAMVDTGNRLLDPITGGKVILLSPEVIRESLGSLADIDDAVEFISEAGQYAQSGVAYRLIPFSSVGGSGMLPAFTPRRLILNGKSTPECTVAISRKASGDGFNAIV